MNLSTDADSSKFYLFGFGVKIQWKKKHDIEFTKIIFVNLSPSLNNKSK